MGMNGSEATWGSHKVLMDELKRFGYNFVMLFVASYSSFKTQKKSCQIYYLVIS